MLWLSVLLLRPATDRRVVVDASVALLRSIGGINLKSVEKYLSEVRRIAQQKEDEMRLGQ